MAFTTINKPSDYFNTKLYTGNGSTNAITGVGFQPDWVWIKTRSEESNHMLFDIIRGTGKELHSQNTEAEITQANTLTTFDSDGFTLGSNGNLNRNTETYVAWNWLADNTSGSSNTDGSITSTVSANTTSGFSIVSYTGTGSNATVGHGLSVAPKVVIVKSRSNTESWVYGSDQLTSWSYYLSFNQTIAQDGPYTNIFNGTAPTSTYFNVGTNNATNASSYTYIAYCFAEKKGFSKFGSYVGNGGNQFIYTGFKPAFVLEKRSSNTSEWDIYDNKRNTFNSVTKVLKPNASDAEATYGGLNFLSNGFEAKGSLNDSGQTLIYMAFAESPFTTSTGIPTTAR